MSIVQQEKRFHKTMSIFKIAHDINSAATALGDVNDRTYRKRFNSHATNISEKLSGKSDLPEKVGIVHKTKNTPEGVFFVLLDQISSWCVTRTDSPSWKS